MISLVGHHHGRKIIRWGYVLVTFVLITLGGAFGGVGVYAIFTKAWNPLALWVGPIAGVFVTALSLAVSFRTPAQRLPFLKHPNLP